MEYMYEYPRSVIPGSSVGEHFLTGISMMGRGQFLGLFLFDFPSLEVFASVSRPSYLMSEMC
jgi:hypothetical protein